MRAITYGTFDFCHEGHIKLLKRIKDKNNFLIVGLSTDEFNEQKGKKSYFNFEERKATLLKTGLVDKIIPEERWSQKIHDIKNFNIDVFYMGSDWTGKFNFLEDYCQVIYLPRTPNISSSQLKNKINYGGGN